MGDAGSLFDSELCGDGGGIDQSAVRSIPAPLNENGGPLRGVVAIPTHGQVSEPLQTLPPAFAPPSTAPETLPVIVFPRYAAVGVRFRP